MTHATEIENAIKIRRSNLFCKVKHLPDEPPGKKIAKVLLVGTTKPDGRPIDAENLNLCDYNNVPRGVSTSLRENV